MMLRTLILLSTAAVFAVSPLIAQEQIIAQERRGSGETPTPQESAQKFVQEKRSVQARYIEELRSQGIAYGEVRSLISKFRNTFKANTRVARTGLADEISDVF